MKVIFPILLFALSAHADLLRSQFDGIRAMGMGNSYIALADDSNALWTNPAGLGRYRRGALHLIDINGAWDSQDTLTRLKNALFAGDIANLIRPDTELVRFGIFPKFFLPYFGFGFFEQFQSFTDIGNLNSPRVDIFTYLDLGAIAGFGFPMGDYAAFGFSTRFIQRSGIDAFLTPNELLANVNVNIENAQDFNNAAFNFLKKMLRSGYAFGLNVGFLGRVPLKVNSPKWTYGITVEDLGDTAFKSISDGVNAPASIIANYNIGTALQYTMSKTSVFNIALDFRNIYEAIPFFKMAHLGLEYKNQFFSLRAGVNQAAITYGASLEFPPHTRLHIASYAVELSDTPFARTQRYYITQLIIGMNPF